MVDMFAESRRGEHLVYSCTGARLLKGQFRFGTCNSRRFILYQAWGQALRRMVPAQVII